MVTSINILSILNIGSILLQDLISLKTHLLLNMFIVSIGKGLRILFFKKFFFKIYFEGDRF